MRARSLRRVSIGVGLAFTVAIAVVAGTGRLCVPAGNGAASCAVTGTAADVSAEAGDSHAGALDASPSAEVASAPPDGNAGASAAPESTRPVGCPLGLPSATERSWRSNAAGRSWTYLTTSSAAEVGQTVLSQLEEGGWSLNEAGYLGLGDSSWGCVATSTEKRQVLMVYSVPERIDAAPDGQGDLRVSVIALDPVWGGDVG